MGKRLLINDWYLVLKIPLRYLIKVYEASLITLPCLLNSINLDTRFLINLEITL